MREIFPEKMRCLTSIKLSNQIYEIGFRRGTTVEPILADDAAKSHLGSTCANVVIFGH
jgi:hypothetical protein